ncbi:MAG: hypothetical protein WBE72_06345 [Terracidiphilus sp.]
MHLSGLPTNGFTNVLSQLPAGLVGRASTAAKSFESELESGNVSGAQSFLSTLQTKLSAGSSSAAPSAISSQIAQLDNDLKCGNLAAAQSDDSTLELALSKLKQGRTPPIEHKANQQNPPPSQGIVNPGNSPGSALAALESYNPIQQSAFTGAVNLSLPVNLPSFSVSS